MGYQNLLVETRDGITFVTVNRPDKLNALNDRTVEELDAAFAALAADPATRGVILTGAGEKAFVAGAGIAEPGTPSPGARDGPPLPRPARVAPPLWAGAPRNPCRGRA